MIVDVKNKIGRNNRILEIINLIQKKDIDVTKLEYEDYDNCIYFNVVSKNNTQIQFSYQLGFGKLSYLSVLAHGDKFLWSDGFILSKEDARDELNNLEGFESEINYLKSFLSSEIIEKQYYYNYNLYKKEYKFHDINTNEII